MRTLLYKYIFKQANINNYIIEKVIYQIVRIEWISVSLEISKNRTWQYTHTPLFHLSREMTRLINRSSIKTPKVNKPHTHTHAHTKLIKNYFLYFYSSKTEIHSELSLDYDIHIASSNASANLVFFFNRNYFNSCIVTTIVCLLLISLLC